MQQGGLMQERKVGERRASIGGYRREIGAKLELLNEVFAAAAVGDFSKDVPMPEQEDEFTELFVGVQIMIEVIREKMTELANSNLNLEDRVREIIREREQSDEILRSVVENAPNFIEVLDNSLNIVFVNRAVESQPGDLIGRKFGDFLSDAKERKRVEAILKNVLKTGQPAQYETSVEVREGVVAWYHTSAGPIYQDGGIAGLVLVATDISRAKKTQESLAEYAGELERSSKLTNALLDSIGEGLIVIDANGNVANANPIALDMLGYAKEDLIGQWFPGAVQALQDGKVIDPADRPALKALSTGKAVTTVAHYQRMDGSQFPAVLTVAPVLFEGKPIGAIEVFRDFSKERELENAKEEFVSLASHQLRTPATGVKAYVSMLLDGYAGDMTEQQKSYIEKVYETNERQLQVINDMLNVARLDAGRLILEPTHIDMKRLIREVVRCQQPVLSERKQTVKLDFPSSPAVFVGDANLLDMMIENLVTNASKYTPEGGDIVVSLSQTAKSMIVGVTDSGVGIAKVDIPKIFQRFTRVENPLSTERGGTGLGLYLVAQVAKLHKGSIEVVSKPGKGSIFTVELPKKKSLNHRKSLTARSRV
jgi:PAS domain S-box-containing protein